MYRLLVHRDRVLAGEVMPAPWKRLFGRPWRHGRRTQRLELGYRQFSAIVSEIPALFEYIDFRRPPDRIQIAKIGGYPVGPGMEPRKGSDIISHNLAIFGNSV